MSSSEKKDTPKSDSTSRRKKRRWDTVESSSATSSTSAASSSSPSASSAPTSPTSSAATAPSVSSPSSTSPQASVTNATSPTTVPFIGPQPSPAMTIPSPHITQPLPIPRSLRVPQSSSVAPPSSVSTTLSHNSPPSQSPSSTSTSSPSSSSSSSSSLGAIAAEEMNEAMKKTKIFDVLNKQIQEKMKSLNIPMQIPNHEDLKTRLARFGASLTPKTETKGWTPLRLDAEGREIDEHGNVVKIQRNVASLKANINLEMQLKAEEATKNTYLSTPAEIKNSIGSFPSKFIDPELELPKDRNKRSKRTFNFVKKGKYERQAEILRMKQMTKFMKIQYETTTKTEGRKVVYEQLPVPIAEWWDQRILLDSTDYGKGVNKEKITSFVHVPVEIGPAIETPLPPPVPLMLTAQEKKKRRRLQKLEKERERQELVRFGLVPAPENKMRLSTFMRIMSDDAVSDPSAMEAKVRRQIEERKQKHEQHNLQRKLTAEQRREKNKRKYREDTSVECHVAVFLAGELSDESRRLKIERNAQQLGLTGIAVLYLDCNVIVAEGGQKGLKKFTRLLLHRIDWKPTARKQEGNEGEDEDEDEEKKPQTWKKCSLVWQGVVQTATFKNFRFENCRSEAMARKFLADRGVPHYWDMARNFAPQTSTATPTVTPSAP